MSPENAAVNAKLIQTQHSFLSGAMVKIPAKYCRLGGSSIAGSIRDQGPEAIHQLFRP